MAKLDEVLGGIVNDIIRLQNASDQSSKEVLNHYQSDDLLKHLDAPRFKLNDIKVNLKFAIQSVESLPPSEGSIREVEKVWMDILVTDVFSNLLSQSGLEKDEIKELELKVLSSEIGRTESFNLDKALKGENRLLTNRSLSYLMDVFRQLPPALSRKVGPQRNFQVKARKYVAAKFMEKESYLKNMVAAKTAQDKNVEIIVDRETLSTLSESKIHEVSFNLTPDFIRLESDNSEKKTGE